MTEATKARPKRRRRLLLLLLAISSVLTLACGEVVARIATTRLDNGMSRIGPIVLLPFPQTTTPRAPSPDTKPDYIVPDAELGWCTGPSVGDSNCRTNRQAARGGPEAGYSREVPAGKLRVLTFGDSFTHCDEVGDAETWQAQLNAIRPDVEAVNFGVPGYGTDQAFLRWRRESQSMAATVSMLCIWPENICRNLNLDRLYLVPTGPSTRKPRFVLRDDRLELIGQPCIAAPGIEASAAVADVMQHDVWRIGDETEWRFHYHSRLARLAASALATWHRRDLRNALYSGEDPRGNEVTVAICRQFVAEARDRGTRPVVVIIPMRDLLAEYPGGDRPLPLVRMLRESGIETWDLSPTFAAAPDLDGLNPPKRHMTGKGNRLIAETLAGMLPKSP